jgi:hypothetical protein
MENIKDKGRFLEPDPRRDFFGGLTLEMLYDLVESTCRLHEGIPEEIQSYFNTILMLYLYGWLYYPFYTLASELSAFAVEMALRKKFPAEALDKKGRDPRKFPELLRHAKKVGLLHDEGFPSLENRRANSAELEARIDEVLGRECSHFEAVPFVDTLIETLPWLRNHFAHPKIRSILPPGPALDSLMVASETINQLWPVPTAE